MRIDIRAAVQTDIADITAVLDASWRDTYSDILSEEQTALYTGENRISAIQRLLLKNTDIFVLLIDGEISAVCVADDCDEKGFYGYVCIQSLCVLPELKRRGLGRKLLNHTLRKMREKGYRYAVLDVVEHNVAARLFYEKIGFTAVKTDTSKEFDNITRVIYKIEL